MSAANQDQTRTAGQPSARPQSGQSAYFEATRRMHPRPAVERVMRAVESEIKQKRG